MWCPTCTIHSLTYSHSFFFIHSFILFIDSLFHSYSVKLPLNLFIYWMISVLCHVNWFFAVELPKQVTVAIIKPDAVKAGLVDEIIQKVQLHTIKLIIIATSDKMIHNNEALEFNLIQRVVIFTVCFSQTTNRRKFVFCQIITIYYYFSCRAPVDLKREVEYINY